VSRAASFSGLLVAGALAAAGCLLDWPAPPLGATSTATAGGSAGIGGTGASGGGGQGGSPIDPCAACPALGALVPEPARPSGRVVPVADAAALEAALLDAAAGDEIVLDAGVTYAGSFTVGTFAGDGVVTVRTSAADQLPSRCERIGAEHQRALARLVGTDDRPALRVLDDAHHYRFVGLEITVDVSAGMPEAIVVVGDRNQSNAALLPHDLELVHVDIHGDAVLGSPDGVRLDGGAITIVGSRIHDVFDPDGDDPRAISGANGAGPFVIANNELESEGDFVSFGPGPPGLADVVPADIAILWNTGVRPSAWGSGLFHRFVLLSNAERVTIHGNRFENAAGSAAVYLGPLSQYEDPSWAHVSEVTITANELWGAERGVVTEAASPPPPVAEVVVRDNVFEVLGHSFVALNTPTDGLSIKHNTAVRDADVSGERIINVGDGGSGTTFSFNDNVATAGTYGIVCNGIHGEGCLDVTFASWAFDRNVIIGGSSSQFPAGQTFPATDSLFVDPAARDFRIRDDSALQGTADDPPGSDPGADFDVLAEAAVCRGEG
jgi:hypothetical protein